MMRMLSKYVRMRIIELNVITMIIICLAIAAYIYIIIHIIIIYLFRELFLAVQWRVCWVQVALQDALALRCMMPDPVISWA